MNSNGILWRVVLLCALPGITASGCGASSPSRSSRDQSATFVNELDAELESLAATLNLDELPPAEDLLVSIGAARARVDAIEQQSENDTELQALLDSISARLAAMEQTAPQATSPSALRDDVNKLKEQCAELRQRISRSRAG